jgi:hypothetical protein
MYTSASWTFSMGKSIDQQWDSPSIRTPDQGSRSLSFHSTGVALYNWAELARTSMLFMAVYG